MTESETSIEILKIMKSQIGCFGSEGVKEMKERAIDDALKALTEIQQYRSIGTVEECREAAERKRAKKPLEYEVHEEYDDGLCPNCKEAVNSVFNNCMECGQKLLWGESEGEYD